MYIITQSAIIIFERKSHHANHIIVKTYKRAYNIIADELNVCIIHFLKSDRHNVQTLGLVYIAVPSSDDHGQLNVHIIMSMICTAIRVERLELLTRNYL